jgi:hypothetical protein
MIAMMIGLSSTHIRHVALLSTLAAAAEAFRGSVLCIPGKQVREDVGDERKPRILC